MTNVIISVAAVYINVDRRSTTLLPNSNSLLTCTRAISIYVQNATWTIKKVIHVSDFMIITIDKKNVVKVQSGH